MGDPAALATQSRAPAGGGHGGPDAFLTRSGCPRCKHADQLTDALRARKAGRWCSSQWV